MATMPLERESLDLLWDRRATSSVARDELVRRHLHIARSLALRYRNRAEHFDDLVQVANLGLVKAVARFDPGRETSFIAYASPTILGELRRYFRDSGWSVHVPRGAKELSLEVGRAAEQLSNMSGHSPTIIELAAHLGRPVEDVVQGLEAAQGHFATSLQTPSGGDDDPEAGTLMDRQGRDEEGYALAETRFSLPEAVRRLPHLERRALELRMQRDLTQSEVALELGCSQMQVSRLLRRAVQRLREELTI